MRTYAIDYDLTLDEQQIHLLVSVSDDGDERELDGYVVLWPDITDETADRVDDWVETHADEILAEVTGCTHE